MIIKAKTWLALTNLEKLALLNHLTKKDGKYLLERGLMNASIDMRGD